MNDEKYMDLAIIEAKKAKDKGGLPFGAVIVRDKKIISAGYSKENELNDVTAHAETQAVSIACKKLGLDLSGCIIYATGEPCNMCAAAIFHALISKVIIGASRVDLPHIFRKRNIGIDTLAGDCAYKVQIIREVKQQECIDLFRNIAVKV